MWQKSKYKPKNSHQITREKRTKKNCGNNQKIINHIITPYLSIIIINLNRLMLQSKEIQWMNDKTRTVYMMLTRDSHPFYRNKLKMGGWKKVRSVQFRHSVISNSLWPHRLQHTRLPCTSPAPGGCWNSCPLIQWCHPTTSSSVVHFCWLQFFLASWSFPWVSYGGHHGHHQVAKVL